MRWITIVKKKCLLTNKKLAFYFIFVKIKNWYEICCLTGNSMLAFVLLSFTNIRINISFFLVFFLFFLGVMQQNKAGTKEQQQQTALVPPHASAAHIISHQKRETQRGD